MRTPPVSSHFQHCNVSKSQQSLGHCTFHFSFWLANLEGVIYLPTIRDYQFCTIFENTLLTKRLCFEVTGKNLQLNIFDKQILFKTTTEYSEKQLINQTRTNFTHFTTMITMLPMIYFFLIGPRRRLFGIVSSAVKAR